ncbi:carbohydrate ABC transporter permease [Saccharibacillus sp. CPCC 101409]|uniref:carbohydrate ABC transporter permease n=1 Tax=Saccharibacillus sp. CPCC 101409 TaxID=3058041 RepID=UPI002672ED85|nr:carbohydrate ABC transporter permease [Saccharibacillus sp. CPCC 101409]MDO3412486.1 carbohydrate ABC transporter permease [Saccharibacillus sp. CPCC 101409]
MKIKNRSVSDRIYLTFVYVVLSLLCASIVLPMMQVLTVSVSPVEVINSYGFHLFPTRFDFSGYREVFRNSLIWTAYGNTIFRTVLGTALTVLLTFMGAYPLSKKSLPHRPFWTALIVFTMFFSGGLIPSYMLIKNLGLMNSVWSLVLPGAVSVFLLLIVRNFISALPESLEESAKIDGAGELYILWKIIMPLSMPILATVSLYSAVGHWNAWFDSMLYIRDEHKQVLQLILRKIVIEGTIDPAAGGGTDLIEKPVNSESMKMATLVVSILPIICVYPFLQKYFVKGTMLGSVKG